MTDIRTAARILLSTVSSPDELETRVESVVNITDTYSANDLLNAYPDVNFLSTPDSEYDECWYALRSFYDAKDPVVTEAFFTRASQQIVKTYAERRSGAWGELCEYDQVREINIIQNEIRLYYLMGLTKVFDRMRKDQFLKDAVLDVGDNNMMVAYENMLSDENSRAVAARKRNKRDREDMERAMERASEMRASRPKRSAADRARSRMMGDNDDATIPSLYDRSDDGDAAWRKDDSDSGISDSDDDHRPRKRRASVSRVHQFRGERGVRVGRARFKNLIMDGDADATLWDISIDRYRRSTLERADLCEPYHPDAVVAARLENGAVMNFAATWDVEHEKSYVESSSKAALDSVAGTSCGAPGDVMESLWPDVQKQLADDTSLIEDGDIRGALEADGAIADEYASAQVDDMVSATYPSDTEGTVTEALLEITRDSSRVEFLTVTTASRVRISTPLERRTLMRIVSLERARDSSVLILDAHPLIEERKRRATHVKQPSSVPEEPLTTTATRDTATEDSIVKEVLGPDAAELDGSADPESLMRKLSDMETRDRMVVEAARSHPMCTEEAHRHVFSLTSLTTPEKRRMEACTVSAADLEALHPDFVRSLSRDNFTNFVADNASYSTQHGRPMHKSKLKTEEGYDNFTIGVFRDKSGGRMTNPFVKVVGRMPDNSRKTVRHGSFTDACTTNIVCNWLNSQPYAVRMCPNAGRLLIDLLMPPAFSSSNDGDYVRVRAVDRTVLHGPCARTATPRDVIWGTMVLPYDVEGVLSVDVYPSYGSKVTLTQSSGDVCKLEIPFSPAAACTKYEHIVSHMYFLLNMATPPTALPEIPGEIASTSQNDSVETTLDDLFDSLIE